ncbi:unnamed protein product [Dibothriocephalus latus]|uniref:Uncharacterized protein n=1 Tax=Dibothriocephalus latus TaxID=60516 RepID=A0A3P7PI78_DIBLA|nr:unnamed protein product [Dibothriocephalus latus]
MASRAYGAAVPPATTLPYRTNSYPSEGGNVVTRVPNRSPYSMSRGLSRSQLAAEGEQGFTQSSAQATTRAAAVAAAAASVALTDVYGNNTLPAGYAHLISPQQKFFTTQPPQSFYPTQDTNSRQRPYYSPTTTADLTTADLFIAPKCSTNTPPSEFYSTYTSAGSRRHQLTPTGGISISSTSSLSTTAPSSSSLDLLANSSLLIVGGLTSKPEQDPLAPLGSLETVDTELRAGRVLKREQTSENASVLPVVYPSQWEVFAEREH